jgi:hypothetical protein
MARSPRLLPCTFLLALACGAPARPAPPQAPVALAVGRGDSTPVAATACTESNLPASPSRSERDAGIDAFVAGRMKDAVEHLHAARKADPSDRAVQVIGKASFVELAVEMDAEIAAREAPVRVTLAALPFVRTKHRKVDAVPTAKVHLEKVSETRNAITDADEWEKKNGLPKVTLSLMPLPALDSAALRRAWLYADHLVAWYGDTVLVAGVDTQPLAFDVTAAVRGSTRPFEVMFGQLVGSTLILELGYNGYAKDSAGRNAYVAAYDSTTGALLWSSEPLVGNASEALVSGGSLVVGYGFTAEPDALFVLDLATGTVEQKIPVKSAPELMRLKGDRLFVRSYDTDYVFKSTTGFAPPTLAKPAPKTSPPTARPAPIALSSETRCWIHRAGAAIAARDIVAMRRAEDHLAPIASDTRLRELVEILHAEALKAEDENLQ